MKCFLSSYLWILGCKGGNYLCVLLALSPPPHGPHLLGTSRAEGGGGVTGPGRRGHRARADTSPHHRGVALQSQ